jgi:hypothetical protein
MSKQSYFGHMLTRLIPPPLQRCIIHQPHAINLQDPDMLQHGLDARFMPLNTWRTVHPLPYAGALGDTRVTFVRRLMNQFSFEPALLEDDDSSLSDLSVLESGVLTS